MDDRYDMYPRSIIDEYFTLTRAKPGWADVLRRNDIQVIVWPRDDPFAALVAASGHWRTIERDRARVVLVRDDVTLRSPR
jgi:hypothetical protein